MTRRRRRRRDNPAQPRAAKSNYISNKKSRLLERLNRRHGIIKNPPRRPNVISMCAHKPQKHTHTRTHRLTDRQIDRQTGHSSWLVVGSDREANTIKAKLSIGDYFGLWAPGVRIKHAPADCSRRCQNQNQNQKQSQNQHQCKCQSQSLAQFPIPSHSFKPR